MFLPQVLRYVLGFEVALQVVRKAYALWRGTPYLFVLSVVFVAFLIKEDGDQRLSMYVT